MLRQDDMQSAVCGATVSTLQRDSAISTYSNITKPKGRKRDRMKQVKCNECGHRFETAKKDNSRISCPKCKGNMSLSIR